MVGCSVSLACSELRRFKYEQAIMSLSCSFMLSRIALSFSNILCCFSKEFYKQYRLVLLLRRVVTTSFPGSLILSPPGVFAPGGGKMREPGKEVKVVSVHALLS